MLSLDARRLASSSPPRSQASMKPRDPRKPDDFRSTSFTPNHGSRSHAPEHIDWSMDLRKPTEPSGQFSGTISTRTHNAHEMNQPPSSIRMPWSTSRSRSDTRPDNRSARPAHFLTEEQLEARELKRAKSRMKVERKERALQVKKDRAMRRQQRKEQKIQDKKSELERLREIRIAGGNDTKSGLAYFPPMVEATVPKLPKREKKKHRMAQKKLRSESASKQDEQDEQDGEASTVDWITFSDSLVAKKSLGGSSQRPVKKAHGNVRSLTPQRTSTTSPSVPPHPHRPHLKNTNSSSAARDQVSQPTSEALKEVKDIPTGVDRPAKELTSPINQAPPSLHPVMQTQLQQRLTERPDSSHQALPRSTHQVPKSHLSTEADMPIPRSLPLHTRSPSSAALNHYGSEPHNSMARHVGRPELPNTTSHPSRSPSPPSHASRESGVPALLSTIPDQATIPKNPISDRVLSKPGCHESENQTPESASIGLRANINTPLPILHDPARQFPTHRPISPPLSESSTLPDSGDFVLKHQLVRMYMAEEALTSPTAEHHRRSEVELGWLKAAAHREIKRSRLSSFQAISLSDHLKAQDQLSSMVQGLMKEWIGDYTLNKKPIAYIIGDIPFGNMTFTVQPPVLIPRPETEEWICKLSKAMKACFDLEKAHAVNCVASDCSQSKTAAVPQNYQILDIGTGSGCISNYLACQHSDAIVVGADVDNRAIELAKRNAFTHGLTLFQKRANKESWVGHCRGQSSFILADVFSPSFGEEVLRALHRATDQYRDETTREEEVQGFDMIVSNPPYITRADYQHLPSSVKNWESPLALIGQRGSGTKQSLERGERTLSRELDHGASSQFFTKSTSLATPPLLPHTLSTMQELGLKLPKKFRESSASGEDNDEDGLDFYREIIELISKGNLLRPSWLMPSNQSKLPRLVLEVGKGQAEAVQGLMLTKLQPAGLVTRADIWEDFSGVGRVVVGYHH